MDLDNFWSLVEKSREVTSPTQAEGNMDRQSNALKRLLSALPASEVIQFSTIMDELLRRAYTWDLWGAAYIIAEGCSDDWFQYFRAWLISRGQAVFEKALTNPESLADSAYSSDVETIFFEHFLYIPNQVLNELGDQMPEVERPFPDDPSGQEWHEDDLKARFPRLWHRAAQQHANSESSPPSERN